MTSVLLPDQGSVLDLKVMLERARRMDDDAAVRLQASGDVLVVTTGVLARPTTLAMRALRLAGPGEMDCVVAASSILERLARLASSAGPAELTEPPVQVRAVWAGVSPPRTGWQDVAVLTTGQVRASAAQGVAEVAAGVPQGAGSAAVSSLRERVWGRPLAPEVSAPAGLALAADAMGFLAPDDAEPVRLFTAGPWHRLALSRGQCLARSSLLG